LGCDASARLARKKLGKERPIIPRTSAQEMHTIQQLMPSGSFLGR
jgi:hypothetical protein